MRETIRLIGSAIRNGSTYLPIRNHAAALAAQAPPKDFYGQVKNIYEDALKRWRYVKDPVSAELLTFSPHALWQLVLAGDGIGVGKGVGAGDCDCIAAALGAELEAIGMPVRIGTTTPPGFPPGKIFGHVFIQAAVPGRGWVTVDPVLHPAQQFSATPEHSRIAFFDLSGRLISAHGNVIGLSGTETDTGDKKMRTIRPLNQWTDIGMRGTSDSAPADWRNYGLADFGSYSDDMGIIDCRDMALPAQVEYEFLEGPDGVVRMGARTPILEVTPADFRRIKKIGRPRHGMIAVGDTGAIYEFNGQLGFFSKIVGAVKSAVSKVSDAVKHVVKKIPGGDYLVKLGEKSWALSKKFVTPLAKFVGKHATLIAPVAALIPGAGPAIAAGLYASGKVAKLMAKHGVKLKGDKGKPRKLKFKSGDSAKKFQRDLRKIALKEAKKRKRKGGKVYAKQIKKDLKRRKKGFLGAPPFRRRIRRQIRRRAGLPVRPLGPLAMLSPLQRQQLLKRYPGLLDYLRAAR